ncbi:MAG: hypothetical protein WBP81_07280 [Solirubrobacteraceae bacterium]
MGSIPVPAAGIEIRASVRSLLISTVAEPVNRSRWLAAAASSRRIERAIAGVVTSRALTTTVTGVLWLGNAAWMRSKLRTTGIERDSDSVPGSEMCIPSAGIASATRTPPLSSTHRIGRRSTRSTICDQIPAPVWRRRQRTRSGSRPFSTWSPSAESMQHGQRSDHRHGDHED